MWLLIETMIIGRIIELFKKNVWNAVFRRIIEKKEIL